MKALLVAAALVAPVAAFAQTDAEGVYRRSYLQVRMGAALPQHDDLDGLEAGFAWEASLGYYLTPHVALEAGVGHARVSGVDVVQDPLAPVTVEASLAIVPITATVKLGAPAGDRAFLYGLVGAGISLVSLEAKARAPGFVPRTLEETDGTPSIHYGIGAWASLPGDWTLGAELRVLVAKPTLLDDEIRVDTLYLTGAVGYRF